MKDETKRRSPDRRLFVIQGLILAWLVVIGVRLIGLQVGQHGALQARAEHQQQASIELSPMRGIVYDRDGNELARSVEAKSLYASPAEISDPAGVASRLAKLLNIDREQLYKRLTSNQVLVAVKRKLSDKEVPLVEGLGLPGLRFVNEMKRYYVSGATAAHVLGFVDVDEHGVAGVEQAYDKMVRGQSGRLNLDVDAMKKSYDHDVQEPLPGANITLTINTLIQHYAERALVDAIRASHARGGTIVIVKPSTGEILALANFPTFDPNNTTQTTDLQRRDRAVETAFEPGSIFKLVTYSAALEERVIKPDSRIDCGGGQIRIADRVVHDHHYGVLTATQALAKSSNVAAIKIGMMLGNERLSNYIEKYGFGRRTGIELPGESRGLFRPASEWGPTSIGSIPMGHEVGVTAVQAVAAYACIANGGEWVQPHLVTRVTSSSGDLLDETHVERRQVVSERTANTLRTMLESVVVQGTGKAAQIGGYRAAGKTGTAQKIDPVTGRYSNTRYVASFAGFAPAKAPELACIVSIDEPVGAHHGGDVAAPVFARVVADALHALGVPPEDDPAAGLLAGDFQVFDLPRSLVESNRPAKVAVDDSQPLIEVAMRHPDEANRKEFASNGATAVAVPDLTGRGLREAVALCAARGLKLQVSGDGVVSSQKPAPETLVPQDTICYVKLSRQPAKKEERKGKG